MKRMGFQKARLSHTGWRKLGFVSAYFLIGCATIAPVQSLAPTLPSNEQAPTLLASDQRPERIFAEAERAYADRDTAVALASFRKALATGLGGQESAAALYYLAESAFMAHDVYGVLDAAAELLAADGVSPWRNAVEGLVAAMAREDWVLSFSVTDGSAVMQALGLYVQAERAYLQGNDKEASRLFQRLAREFDLKPIGLNNSVTSRLAELNRASQPVTDSLGVVLPLTGRAAPYGQAIVRGLLLALDPFHAPSRKLWLADDQGEPYLTARAFYELRQRGAMVMVGPLLGRTATVGVCAANALGVPTIILSGTEIPALGPWAVRTGVTARAQAEALLDDTMGRRGFQRFAILYPDDAAGVSFMHAFWDAVVARGGQITGAEAYKAGATDFQAAVKALIGFDDFSAEEIRKRKEAKQPLAHLDFDAVFIPDGPKTAALLIPQLIYYDVRGPLFLGPTYWDDPHLIEWGRGYVEGVLFVEWFWADAPNATTKAFLQKHRATFGDERALLPLTAQGYEAGLIVGRALSLDDRDTAREVIRAARWEGFSGPAYFTAVGEVEREFYRLTVSGKAIVPIDGVP